MALSSGRAQVKSLRDSSNEAFEWVIITHNSPVLFVLFVLFVEAKLSFVPCRSSSLPDSRPDVSLRRLHLTHSYLDLLYLQLHHLVETRRPQPIRDSRMMTLFLAERHPGQSNLIATKYQTPTLHPARAAESNKSPGPRWCIDAASGTMQPALAFHFTHSTINHITRIA
jgi:hypothetical protein